MGLVSTVSALLRATLLGKPASGAVNNAGLTAFCDSFAEVFGVDAAVEPVGDLTDLAALDVTGFRDGTMALVKSVADWYRLDQSGVHTADGVSVVAAAGIGTGYWVSMTYGRWDDLREDPRQAGGISALTQEAWADTVFDAVFLRHDQNDRLSFAFQLPHEWDGGVIVPHLHLSAMVNPAVPQDAYFEWGYAWTDIGETQPLNVGWATDNDVFTVGVADVRKHRVFSLGEITPPANQGGSTCFKLWIQRSGSSGSDTYTTGKATPPGTAQANLELIFADLHYRKGSQGSEQETPP